MAQLLETGVVSRTKNLEHMVSKDTANDKIDPNICSCPLTIFKICPKSNHLPKLMTDIT